MVSVGEEKSASLRLSSVFSSVEIWLARRAMLSSVCTRDPAKNESGVQLRIPMTCGSRRLTSRPFTCIVYSMCQYFFATADKSR